MPDTLTPLICDFLEWVDRAPRSRAEVMENWKTSCPGLPVWEEATGNGHVGREGNGVVLTDRGRAFLAKRP